MVLEPREEREDESAGAPEEALKLIGRDPRSLMVLREASEVEGSWWDVKKPAWRPVRRSERANRVTAMLRL